VATHDYVISNGTGSAVRSDINGALAAIVSQNSNASAPATTYAYMRWADTTAGVMKMRNGANSAWISLYQLDGEWTSIAFENGTAAAPSIYFKDSGTDTGIYSPGTDQVALSTNGVVRLTTSTTAVSSALAIDHPLGAAGTPSITFTGDLNTGIYSPGADQVAISTNGTGRLFVDASGKVGINTSPARDLTVYGSSSGLSYLQLAHSAASGASRGFEIILNATESYFINRESGPTIFVNGGNERMRLTSAGLLGLGTSSPGAQLQINTGSAATIGQIISLAASQTADVLKIVRNDTNNSLQFTPSGQLSFGDIASPATTVITLGPSTSTNANLKITANNAGNPNLLLQSMAGGGGGVGSPTSFVYFGDNNRALSYVGGIKTNASASNASSDLVFGTTPDISATAITERLRITSGGNVGIGTTSPGSLLDLRSASAPSLHISDTGFTPDYRGYSIDLSRAQQTGGINFTASSPSGFLDLYAGGSASALGGWDGQIRFFTGGTNAYGTERVRITSGGNLRIGQSTTDGPGIAGDNTVGTAIGGIGYVAASRDGNVALYVNRKTNDGDLVLFYQDATQEGSISVSGTTVSYNGAHLSRWSQLPGGATREEILRGTVLSNIDEMCGWGEEANEQLNRMKVSDVEGDKNVSGVFQAWDDDDDTYTDDFYCAMTGDFIIRIAEGVTVERGDLLMSAGDGTAKPQDDDIIRSKTIAKVTSTHVTCTYEDGSYCVPCVLMAC